MEGQSETLTRIHQAAMEEFLEKGFADAPCDKSSRMPE